jgi:hypothetical protein
MLSDMVKTQIVPNFKKLGLKKGMLHIYLRDGDAKESASKVANMEGMMSCSLHVGNSDIVSEFFYRDSEHLFDTISEIKHFGGVEKTLWSEEIINIPIDRTNIVSYFKKINNGNGPNGLPRLKRARMGR